MAVGEDFASVDDDDGDGGLLNAQFRNVSYLVKCSFHATLSSWVDGFLAPVHVSSDCLCVHTYYCHAMWCSHHADADMTDVCNT